MNAGRGYVIRFYDEKQGKTIFYTGSRGSIYNNGRKKWNVNLDQAEVFISHEDAVTKLVDIKKETSKTYNKGYLYIAKIFYTERKRGFGTKNTILVATKLTKPDRHDFLNAI